MENKIQKEEFDPTEVKIQEVESDISDGWEIMSKHEAEMESVPHLSVPKMHEQIEKFDSTSHEIGINSGRLREQGIFSHQFQEKEHEIVQKEMEEAMQENLQREEENERVRSEMVEPMQNLNQDHEEDRRKRKIRDLIQTVHQNKLKKERLTRELHQLRQTLHQIEKEKDSGRKILYELGQTMPQNEKEEEINRMRRAKETHESKLDATQNEQQSNIDNRKTDEVMQDKESAFTAAEHSESQIHADEDETSAKGIDEDKTKVLTNEINEAFQQFFGVNQAAEVVIPAKKTDKLEEKKHVKLSSKQAEIFRKEGIEFASSDDESNE